MRRAFLSALVVCAVGVAHASEAPDRWMVELRGGATQATEQPARTLRVISP